jgi:hypothetical protein
LPNMLSKDGLRHKKGDITMRFWFSGPRLFNGLVRPGVSFGPEDLRARRVPATHMELARKAVRRLAKDNGEEVPPDAAIDAWLGTEIERRRRVGPSIAGFIVRCIIAVPLTIFVIGCFWMLAMLIAAMMR